jgi:hypothetical protein
VNLLVVQRFYVDASHVAVHADHGGEAGREMEVRGFVFDTEGQQLGDIHKVLSRLM